VSNDRPTSPRDEGRPVPPPPPPPGARPVEPFAAGDPPHPVPATYGASPYVTPASFGGPDPTAGTPTYGTPTYGTPTYGGPPSATPPYATSTDGPPTDGPSTGAGAPYGALPPYLPRRNAAALSAFLLGIVSLLFVWTLPTAVVAVPVAALALVVGLLAAVRARRRASRGAGPAVIGVVLAALALAMVGARSAEGPADVGVVPSAEDLALPEGMAGDGAQDADVVVQPWQPLQVAEVAFGPDPADPTVWWYVAFVDNPNPDHRFDLAEMTVEALTADGTLIAARAEYVDALPGRAAVAGTFYDLAGMTPDRVDVRLPVVQDVTYAPGGGGLTAGGLTASASSWGVNVTGTVGSTLEEDVEMAMVVVVATAPGGEVLGSAHGYVDTLPAGGEGAFDADFFVELPAGTQYTAYPSR